MFDLVPEMTDDQLSVALRDASLAVDRAEAHRLAVAAEWDRRQAWAADGSYSGRCWVAHECTLSRAEAGAMLRTARVVASAPLVAAAVADGSLPVAKAEVLASVVTDRTAVAFVRDQEVLLEHARRLAVEEVGKLARYWQRAADEDGAEPAVVEQQVRVTRASDGTVHVKGVLDAEDGATFTTVLDGLADQLWRARRAGTDDERERPPAPHGAGRPPHPHHPRPGPCGRHHPGSTHSTGPPSASAFDPSRLSGSWPDHSARRSASPGPEPALCRCAAVPQGGCRRLPDGAGAPASFSDTAELVRVKPLRRGRGLRGSALPGARQASGAQRRGVPPPHLPSALAAPPDVTDDEQAAPVLPQHGGFHLGAVHDGGDVTVHVDDPFLDPIGVDDVVGQHLEPPVPGHHRHGGLDQHEDVPGMQDILRCLPVASLDAPLELHDPVLEVTRHRRSLTEPCSPPTGAAVTGLAYRRRREGRRLSFVVHRAERADVLAAALAEVLLEPLADPFAPEVVAVHSKGVERWLSNQLATRLGSAPGRGDGICANLQLPFPGRLVGDALARASGIERQSDRWQPERLAWPLLEVVDAHLLEPWLTVLAAHLGAAEPDAPERDRRFAVIRHLAELFDRYAVHRPAMVLAWAAGRDEDGNGGPLPPDAAWQASLWRQLRHAVGTPSPAERLAEGCRALARDPGLATLPPRFSLFGFTRLPASYLEVLRALSVHRDIHLLALHPSPLAWSKIAALPAADAGLAADAVRHPLLRAWGRDSREMQLLLGQRLAQDEAEDRHHPLPAEVPATLLQRLQSAIRADAPPAGAPVRLDPADRSVQVHACHGRARQAEVVRDAITHLLADDPTLEPRDIVVMCPDIDELAPLLHAAFVAAGGGGAEGDHDGQADPVDQVGPAGPPRLPYRLADRSLRQTNPVLGATAELLSLVDARITASQVLTFAGLPPVRERFRLDDDDLARLAGWIRDTGTRWGLDAAARAPYDLAGVEAGTWDFGLVRLLLGVAMAEDEHRLVGGALPLDDVDASDIALAGRFAELVGRLGLVVRTMAGALDIGEWVAAVDQAADLLLATRPADAWQRSQLDRLLGEVLAEAGGAVPSPLHLAEVRDLLADRLRGQPTRAAFRTGDLTMCTLVPMRSVPHRVVCLVGLDDGAFPRAGAPDGDDVLARARQVGDHDRRAEDRQLLLDALLAAAEALVVTYAGRDERTNEELPPAVPVNELLDVLDATARTADGSPARAQVVHHHPLQPSDRRCFLPGQLGTDGPWSFDPDQLGGARAAAAPRRPPAPFLGRPLPPLLTDDVPLVDLVRFVEHPVKAFLRQRLGLGLWNERDLPLDAMAVELDGLAAWGVGDRLVTALLAGGDVDAVCAAEAARGLLPPGGLGRGALADARIKAQAVAAAAEAASCGPTASLDVDVALPDGRRLTGTVPGVVGQVVRFTTFSRLGPKHQIAAWVRFLAATAAHPATALSSATIGRSRSGARTIVAAPLAGTPEGRRQRALELLGILVDLRDRGLCEPLPIFLETSYRYAWALRTGRDRPEEEAARGWASGWAAGRYWEREDKEPAHLLVLDGEQTFADLCAQPPRHDEEGPGWAPSETTRFGRLARRLWDPVLGACTEVST